MVAADPKQPGGPQCNVKVIEKSQMSEINPGVWDGLTVADAKREYPEEWDRFLKDPYTFRAPRAESYHDLSGTYLDPHFRRECVPDLSEKSDWSRH